jgi:hypothetical protein
MLKYRYPALVRSLLLSLSLLLAQSGSLLAQEPSSPAPTQVPGNHLPAAELAAVELPSAPMPAVAIPLTGANSASAAPAAAFVPVIEQPQASTPHRFWDRENRILFAATGALAAADFCTTRANLASGGKELNPVARVFAGSTPALATNFALETAGVMGISYVFHKTGHHRLERLTSFVDIGGSAAAVGYSLAHR